MSRTQASRILFFAAALICLSCAGRLSAHPHMFLDATITVRADQSGVSGVVLAWEFDEWFSSSILLDYDLDKNRRFSAGETADVYENAFSNLENFDYFPYFTVDGDTTAATEVSEFSVKAHENRIIYSFFVPFSVPFSSDRLGFSVAVYDPSFFCDVAYAKDDRVALQAPTEFSLDHEIRTDKSVTISYNNTVIGAGREDSRYTGVAHPDRVEIVVRR